MKTMLILLKCMSKEWAKSQNRMMTFVPIIIITEVSCSCLICFIRKECGHFSLIANVMRLWLTQTVYQIDISYLSDTQIMHHSGAAL